jgi:hypothetical protein
VSADPVRVCGVHHKLREHDLGDAVKQCIPAEHTKPPITRPGRPPSSAFCVGSCWHTEEPWVRWVGRSHVNPMLDGYGWRTWSVETDERLLDVLMGKNMTEEGR